MSELAGGDISQWSGKTWGAIGDSITSPGGGTSTVDKLYHDLIAAEVGMAVTNYGVGGTGWRTPGSGGSNAIYQRMTGFADHDLFTVFAGTNDWDEVGVSMTLGAFGDTSGATSFYGAVDEVLAYLVTTFPTRKIAAFTPIQRGDAWYNLQHGTSGVSLQDVSTAILTVAAKYNVPVLDLYKRGGMYVQDAGFRSAYMSSSSNVHPNDAGHARLAKIMRPFLDGL